MLKGFGWKELLVLLIAVALILSLSVSTGEKQLDRVAYKSGMETTTGSEVSERVPEVPTSWETRTLFRERRAGDFSDDPARYQWFVSDARPRCLLPSLDGNKYNIRRHPSSAQRDFGADGRGDLASTHHRFYRSWVLVRSLSIYTAAQLSAGTLSQPDDHFSHWADGGFTLRVMALSRVRTGRWGTDRYGSHLTTTRYEPASHDDGFSCRLRCHIFIYTRLEN